MRLLIVSQYFWPESFIINDLARTLKEQGHTVVVATGKPNYPEGTVFSGYTAAGVQTEMFDGDMEVVRVPLRPRGKGGALNLGLNYLSFVWSGLRWFPPLLRGRAFDAIVVFAVSPITAAIPAIRLKRCTGAHLAIWVQDSWPESLMVTGYVRNRAILALLRVMVRAIYRRADTLLVQSRPLMARVARQVSPDTVVYYSNSVDISAPLSAPQNGAVPAEFLDLLKTRFCAVFAGNLGTAQALGTLVDAAGLLRSLEDVRIVLVGSGSMYEWVRQQKEARGLDNLILAGRYHVSSMTEVYRHAACLLVTLKDEEILWDTVPSKIQTYLAAGKPIIAALKGEGARIVEEAGAGLTCKAEDAAGLADCVRSLYAMTEPERARLGNAGRRYFLEHFEMRRQAAHLVNILQHRMSVRRSS